MCWARNFLLHLLFKKEWTADIYNNMDDLKSIIVSEKKQDRKDYGLYDFICVKF